MLNIKITPSKIKTFGSPDNAVFCLISNPKLLPYFDIDAAGYDSSIKIAYSNDGDTFEEILTSKIPNKAHILVISPDAFFQSPAQELIGMGRKLIVMACNSTPSDIESIRHFLSIIEKTDPQLQQDKADYFFEVGEQADYLEFLDNVNGTKAKFNHMDDSYLWSEQAGLLSYGEQQLAPSGEISVLPLRIQEFDEQLRLDFNGTIALHGCPILHNGTPSFLRSDQSRIYSALSHIQECAIIAEVNQGVITYLTAQSKKSEQSKNMLQAMFDTDSRYRILWEIGFGVNTKHDILVGNYAMNETFGGTNGAIHFGLGLTPYTQYHLDIICPNTSVVTNNGDVLIGQQAKKNIERNKAIGCLCIG